MPTQTEEVDILIQLLKDPSPLIRANTVTHLGKLMNPKAVEPLIEILLKDQDEEVQSKASEALKNMGTAVAEPFVQAFKNGAPAGARRVIQILVKIGESVIPLLLPHVKDKNPELRAFVVEVLGKFGSKTVVAPHDQTGKDLASPLPMQPARMLWGKGKTQQPAEKSRRPALIIRLTVAVSLLATISWYVFSGTIPTKSQDYRRLAVKDVPIVAIPTPEPPKPILPEETSAKPSAGAPKEPASAVIPRTMAELNNRGVELVAGNDPWRGFYYFDLAHQADPLAVEPLINMGVTLSELGLFAPAMRIFKEASAMAPNHPDLRANLESLAGRGLDKL